MALLDDLGPDDVAVYGCGRSSRFAPLDPKGRGTFADIDVPIRCSGVAVAPEPSQLSWERLRCSAIFAS